MATDQLRNAIKTQPFVPFVIHLADQRSFTVSHPEMIGYGGGRIATVFERGGDAVQIVDVGSVTRLEIQTGESPKTGRKKR